MVGALFIALLWPAPLHLHGVGDLGRRTTLSIFGGRSFTSCAPDNRRCAAPRRGRTSSRRRGGVALSLSGLRVLVSSAVKL